MTDTRDPDELIRRAGRGDPDRDQHFLIDDRVLSRIPTYAEQFDRSHVLEIGPGTGALTVRLLDVAERVTAIERDPALVSFLRTEFAEAIESGRLAVIQGDAVETELPSFTVCISNLPYGASSPLAFRVLRTHRPAVLMFQREVAERMAAEPGTSAYGRLSVAAQHFADVEIVEPVPRTAFDPEPAVESAIVRLTPREPTYSVPDEAAFLALLKALFTQRRKTLRNAVRNTTHLSGIDEPDRVLSALPADLRSKRPDALTPAEFAEIAVVAARVDHD
ncbi:MAG: 16S rRNA (adenine(1518)-N(6)/adenine(1519)-N(6))-dimethyltransferase RsmA [Halodesulfurarchaeum sp.]